MTFRFGIKFDDDIQGDLAVGLIRDIKAGARVRWLSPEQHGYGDLYYMYIDERRACDDEEIAMEMLEQAQLVKDTGDGRRYELTMAGEKAWYEYAKR